MTKTRAAALTALLLTAGCSPDSEETTEGEIYAMAVSADRTLTLSFTCPPDSGSHPDPDAACQALQGTSGSVVRVDGDDSGCPSTHDPVWVVVWGRWGDQEIEEATEYPNLCSAREGSDGVLTFE